MRLSEWNEALVKAIFFDPEREGAAICRMDATGQLLEKISGCDSFESAKRRFIAAFGQDSSAIRLQYRSPFQALVPLRGEGIPSYFAALYLTLLAASGDDDTSGEGVFRRRFAAMLGMEELAAFDFSDLPRMWKDFARWSERAALAGGCARLVLPDPRNEKRIGYSKRLAFPTYADEKCLRQLVSDTGISSASAFRVAERAIFSRLNEFSAAFREEALIFQDLVAKARDEEAFNSPLWGALRDIGFTLEKKSSDSSGRFCLELDLGDPLAPALIILADRRGAASAGLSNAVSLLRVREPYSCLWRGDGLDASIGPLAALAKKDRNFARSWLARALQAGCLPLFSDRFGRISSDGDHYDDGPVGLLALRAQMAPIKAMADHLGLNALWPHVGTGRWAAMFIPGVSRSSLERLAAALPATVQALLLPGWKPERVRIVEAARYGDAILLNPAASPEVRFRGASGGTYELANVDGSRIGGGVLEAHGDGFRIPPKDLIALVAPAICEYRLDAGQNSGIGAAKVAVIPTAPAGAPKPISDPFSWLCDGLDAFLVGLDCAWSEASEPLQARRPLLRRCSESNFGDCSRQSGIASAHVFSWIAEALLTRFQQRATLPFDEVRERVDAASEAAGLAPWKVRRALFASGWLVSVQRRTAPYAEVALGERVLVAANAGSGVAARLCGLIGQYELTQLRRLLAEGERCFSIVPDNAEIAIGSLAITLADSSRACAIAESMGWRLRQKRQPLPCPLAGVLKPETQVDSPTHMQLESNSLAWDGPLRGWTDDKTKFPEAAIMRSRGNQRDTYWVRSDGGLLKTDSFPWAMLLARRSADEGLGVLANNGDLRWDSEFPSLPLPLSYWWMQEGGGCVGIGGDGALVFQGGGGLQQWHGLFGEQAMLSTAAKNGAMERRAMALEMRRRNR